MQITRKKMRSLILMNYAKLHLKELNPDWLQMVTPDWNKEFEIMCDASDYAMGAVLGQRTEKIFKAIYYARKTFNETQENYFTTENEMLTMVFACEKFRPYILARDPML